MTVIYNIVDPVSEMVLYVGKTNNIEKRKQQHLANSHNTALRKRIKTILKRGNEPIFNVLEVCEPFNFSEIEKKWILHFRSLGFEIFKKDKGNLKKHLYKDEPNEIKSLPIYLPYEKYLIFKAICERKKQPMTKIIESLVDKFIKRESIS